MSEKMENEVLRKSAQQVKENRVTEEVSKSSSFRFFFCSEWEIIHIH